MSDNTCKHEAEKINELMKNKCSLSDKRIVAAQAKQKMYSLDVVLIVASRNLEDDPQK
jgi:hypothetical protein